MSFGKIPSTVFMSLLVSSDFNTFKASTCFFPCPSIVFICFSNALPSEEYINLAFYIILV